ncbi:NAD-dependent aldehyde dehydrogenase [Planctomycetales bacterium 10988]|nr:NAD-dependent aldehyde dehydrogenase [Planctomycetales bacterium 10988]
MNASSAEIIDTSPSQEEKVPVFAKDQLAERLELARSAQAKWGGTSWTKRRQIFQRFRELLATRAKEVAAQITLPQRKNIAESLAAEVLPLADACRFLERRGASILSTKSLSTRDRPWWLPGVTVHERRAPWGTILVLGTWNYPLLLIGVQTLQALYAGNAVLLKPGKNSSAAAKIFTELLYEVGLEPDLLTLLDESNETAQAAIHAGVNKVVMTGSARGGEAVLSECAGELIPTTMELSGNDAVFLLPSAAPEVVAKGLAFGLTINGSATCIAPRRVFGTTDQLQKVGDLLKEKLADCPALPIEPAAYDLFCELKEEALQQGATSLLPEKTIFSSIEPTDEEQPRAYPTILKGVTPEMRVFREEYFAPLMVLVEVNSMEEALRFDEQCPYALGASLFGSLPDCSRWMAKVKAGCITVNDLIMPTADPRVAFGGWNRSGFGVTRGKEGLLEMTRPQSLILRRGKWLPHLDPPSPHQEDLLLGLLTWSHAPTWSARWQGLKQFLSAVWQEGKVRRQQSKELKQGK